MGVKVVDASAIGALLFGEPEGEAIVAELTGHTLVGPALLGIEIANICLKKMRRYPEQRQALRAASDLFAAMEIDMMEV
jgi:predicted nucleic acid-binding protein